MPKPNDSNTQLVERTFATLGTLADELTLVGGCVVGFLITDPASAAIRPTFDVDCVVEAASYVEYDAFAKRMSARGWQPGMRPGDPICRWRHAALVVDLLPVHAAPLGFSNRWYPSAVRTRQECRLPSGLAVHHIDAPHFLATKLEAFASRGDADAVASHDIEDVMRVIDGRASIVSECRRAPSPVGEYLRSALNGCLGQRHFLEALPGYFGSAPEAHARARIVEQRLREIIGASDSE